MAEMLLYHVSSDNKADLANILSHEILQQAKDYNKTIVVADGGFLFVDEVDSTSLDFK